MTWKRTGQCQPSKCGAVCCKVGFAITGAMPETKRNGRYWEYFGFKEVKLSKKVLKIVNRVGQRIAIPNMRCSKLSLEGKCELHGSKNKPETCRVFPESRELVFYQICKKLGCTYRFKRISKKKEAKK